MAFKVDGQNVLPKVAASQVNAGVAVVHSASSADQVFAAANATAGILAGITIATAASPGDAVGVQYQGIAKAIAAASVGVGAYVSAGAASAGGLAPVASGSNNQAVGVSQTAAAAGETFSVLIRVSTKVV